MRNTYKFRMRERTIPSARYTLRNHRKENRIMSLKTISIPVFLSLAMMLLPAVPNVATADEQPLSLTWSDTVHMATATDGVLGELERDDFTCPAEGLPSTIQRALDILRVTGNNAVHPGRIDLRDDRATAELLHLDIETLLHKRGDVLVDVLSLLASVLQLQ